jgi:hypothetical protein
MQKEKAAAGLSTRAAKNISVANHIRRACKAAIVRLALWGVLPSRLADWLIRRGGLRDA